MRHALLLFAAACSPSHERSEADAGTAPDDDAGGRDDAGDLDGGAPGCTSPVRGHAEIALLPDEAPIDDQVVALFWEDTACAPEIVGACELRECTSDSSMRLTAGEVELFGDLGEAMLRHDTRQGLYYRSMRFDELWAASGTAGVRASGGAFPAFELEVVLPPLLEVTSVPTGPITGTISFAWTASPGPDVTLHAMAPGGVSIACTYPRTAGTGEIPAELLARLGAVTANIMLNTTAEAEVCAPSHVVSIGAAHRPFDESMEIEVPE
jgi:hypothetical protein